MHIPRPPHNWSLTRKQATAAQKRLAAMVQQRPLQKPLRLVAGVDAAFTGDGRCIGSVVLWDMLRQEVIEEHYSVGKLLLPYIPGLLSFREAPTIIKALRKLERKPELLICDGQGIAHPRRFGIACHLGVLTGIPSIGCAKSRLIGIERKPGPRRGDSQPLMLGQEQLGMLLRTRQNTKHLYVSIGHLIDLESAGRMVLDCCTRHRLPEPIWLADKLAAETKRIGSGSRIQKNQVP